MMRFSLWLGGEDFAQSVDRYQLEPSRRTCRTVAGDDKSR